MTWINNIREYLRNNQIIDGIRELNWIKLDEKNRDLAYVFLINIIWLN